MAEEYCGGVNWWDSSSANRGGRFDSGGGSTSTSSTTTTLATSGGGGGGGYGWLTDQASTTVNINTTHETNKMDPESSLLVGLGRDWNQQSIFRNPEKPENSFRSMLQEGMGLNPNFQQELAPQIQWRDKFSSNEESSDLKRIGTRGFSLDHQQPQFSPGSMESTVTCQGLATPSSFQLDSTSSSSVYGSPSSILQGFVGPDQPNQHQTQMNYHQSYFDQQQLNSPSWAKVPQFLRGSPYWNNTSSPAVNIEDVRPGFLSSLQGQTTMPTFEEKPKDKLELKDTSSTAKKTGPEMNNKRGRNEAASSTLPPFKVRKEKMGDRITALQQLVSPFGKTDTASVLSEAIEYIKFLHEQVSVLCTPYLKSGASYQQQQGNDNANMDPEAPKQDLRSRGLCLVPVSSTFPVAHETAVDVWTPTFGGTFR